MLLLMNIKCFQDHASGIQLLNFGKLTSQLSLSVLIIKCFWGCCAFLAKFSYWSKFHVNNITGSRAMKICLCKGLSRNPEIRNTPVWVFLNIWGLGLVRDITLDTNVSNEMLLNVAKCYGCRFYYFWVIKGQPTEGKG